MPRRSKRQKQLGAAREAKRQKREGGNSQGSQSDEDLQPEQESGQSDDDSCGSSDLDCDENSDDEVDISELVEEYTRDWVDGLDRDDLMSLLLYTIFWYQSSS